jgi:hypothetical protein
MVHRVDPVELQELCHHLTPFLSAEDCRELVPDISIPLVVSGNQ